MKRVGLTVICFLALLTIKAQTTEDSVKAAVNKLFIAMATVDSASIINSFTADGMLQSVSEKDGKTNVDNEKLADFAHVIAGMQKNDADEQIKFNTIKIDGALAWVWAPYNFYYKGKFSHCGVDCFCIVRINNTWKIQYIIDTRRTKACRG